MSPNSAVAQNTSIVPIPTSTTSGAASTGNYTSAQNATPGGSSCGPSRPETCCTRLLKNPQARTLVVSRADAAQLSSITVWPAPSAAYSSPLVATAAALAGVAVSVRSADSEMACAVADDPCYPAAAVTTSPSAPAGTAGSSNFSATGNSTAGSGGNTSSDGGAKRRILQTSWPTAGSTNYSPSTTSGPTGNSSGFYTSSTSSGSGGGMAGYACRQVVCFESGAGYQVAISLRSLIPAYSPPSVLAVQVCFKPTWQPNVVTKLQVKAN